MAHSAPYITLSWFTDRVREGQLSLAPVQDENYEIEQDGDYRDVDQTWIENEISRASEYIDSKVCGRYTVPLQNPEGSIAEMCYTLALEKLFAAGRREDIDIKNDADKVRKFLMDVSMKKKDLPGQTEIGGIPEIVQPFESSDRGGYTAPRFTFANPPWE